MPARSEAHTGRSKMQAALARRIDELVECGWEPITTTETSATLHGRRPFSWWLFLFVVIFWLATSRATVFLHQDGEQVHQAGDLWLVKLQEARREALIEEQRQIKERGFLAAMWPQLLAFLGLLLLWIWVLRRVF